MSRHTVYMLSNFTEDSVQAALPPAPGFQQTRPQRPALLRVTAVAHRYGQRLALDGLSLEVRDGETLGLLGPNGAGKSTLMSLMSGVLAAQSGALTLAGAGSLYDVRARKMIGFAPQALALYPELTAQENLRFFGRLFGLSGGELEARVKWALALAELHSRRHDRVRGFSGGMQRRLNLACAVVHAPRLVLLDEPTVGVDPQSRDHIFTSLERLKADGHTIVYSTHYMEEAERLCDRIAVMDAGRVLSCAPLAQLLASHGGGYRLSARLHSAPPEELLLQLGPTGLAEHWVFDAAAAAEMAGRLAPYVTQLAISPPSLSQVFFNLTGRSLRDE